MPSATRRPSTCPLTPWPVRRVEIASPGERRPRCLGARDDGLGQRMLARLLQARRPAAAGVASSKPASADDVGQRRACPRSACRSCRRSAYRRPPAAPAPRRCGPARPRARRGPSPTMIDIGVASPRAHGTGDDEHGHGRDQRIGERRARARAPARPRRRARRSATTAGTNQAATRRPGPGSARGCAAPRPPCATMRASMVSAPTLRASHDEAAAPVERAAGDVAPGGLLDRHRLAREQRLIDRRAAPSSTMPSTGTASPGRTRSRSPTCDVRRAAPRSRCRRRAMRRAVFGREVQQRADGVAGLSRALQLQHLPEQHQHDDDGGGLEVAADRRRRASWKSCGKMPGTSTATTL